MDLEYDEPRTVKIEWRIENFTCWWRDFHQPYIESPHSPSLPDFKVLLNMSDSLRNEEMNVSCSFGKLRLYEGELSFFGPNERFIRTVEIMPSEEDADGSPVIIPAPDLMKVAKEQQREDNEDHIILMFRFKVEDVLMAVGMCSTIEVISDMTLPFTGSKLLEDPKLGNKPKLLMAITNNRPCENGGEKEERLNLERVFFGRTVDLQLRPVTDWAFRDILIISNFKKWDNTNILVCDGDSFHIFKRTENIGKEPWTICDDILRYNELSDRGSRVVLRLKFLSGKIKSSTGSEIFEAFSDDSSERSSPEPSNIYPPPPFDEKENDSSLKKELMCLYQDKEFTDFELHCENTTFPVHKAILSARSPFFKQLFLSNKEKASIPVNIEDLDAVTLNQFLAFLYSGTVDDLQAESAIKLYSAGDKYQVPMLKTECVKFLSAHISVSNACTILSLADKYMDDQLTSSAKNFIKNNFKAVANSEEWHNYTISNPHLLVKTVSDIAAKGHFDNCFVKTQKI